VYFRSRKSRENPRAERAKQQISIQLQRRLTQEEEHLIELSAVILECEEEQFEQHQERSKAA
jgi:hypothetical protein